MRIRTSLTITMAVMLLVVVTTAQPLHPPSAASAGSAGNETRKSATRSATAGEYVGSEVCAGCHEEHAKSFQRTVMGKVFAHPRTEAEKLNCESCHGPGKAHVDAGGGKDTVAVRFGKDGRNTVEEKNAACTSCHSRGNQLFWAGSSHQGRGMACVDCHEIHESTPKGVAENLFSAPLTDVKSVRKSQPELCLQCHQMRRAQLQRSSHMPYREGKVTCTSCHNPHGSPNPKQLLQATTNENCYSCHAERRGPFTWEHPAVMENCSNCHEAHGSSNPQLLKTRQPRLCDQCHISSRHPTQPQGLNVKVFSRGCTNCHSTIHGSNHPSGNMFLR